ncbi:hypothetical protein HMPREF0541_00703 [Lacticaseibacillus rhamnosus ATCC 21052]|nr:hypothetical protein HMPREF0541_00703 [Lacticaseibacillus rhamnosus ATCC 21052]
MALGVMALLWPLRPRFLIRRFLRRGARYGERVLKHHFNS